MGRSYGAVWDTKDAFPIGYWSCASEPYAGRAYADREEDLRIRSGLSKSMIPVESEAPQAALAERLPTIPRRPAEEEDRNVGYFLMTDIDQLRAAEERLEQAQRSSDIEVLDELLHPEVTYVGPDGHLVDKHADLEAHRSGALRIDFSTAKRSMSVSTTVLV